MDNMPPAGFEEVAHIADWQLHVWAPTLEELFTQATRGMYALANIQFDVAQNMCRELSLEALDHESLLVSFLAELLYFVEADNQAFQIKTIKVGKTSLQARLTGGEVTRQDKEIKAVTFHNLQIDRRDGLFQVGIVFDV
jgi:SHS2 domain-containing protein